MSPTDVVRPRVVLDLERLRHINCGLGRFCLNLTRALLEPGERSAASSRSIRCCFCRSEQVAISSHSYRRCVHDGWRCRRFVRKPLCGGCGRWLVPFLDAHDLIFGM